MFGVDVKDLINDGKIWVFKLDPNVSSINELIAPKTYIYKGRFSTNVDEHILLYDEDLDTEKK